MGDQDLREQVARLLNPAAWNEAIPEANRAIMRKWALEEAEPLLPLFAARERAAAEKGWDEGRRDSADVEWNGTSYSLVAKQGVPNPYTVRAQLEGDGA